MLPGVILCDVGLPDMDGYEVARMVRSDPVLSQVRLVALTGYAQPEDRRRALDAGFDDHLAKPPPPEELARVLSALDP
jgi:CheY-like chemotaxis protein